MLLAAILICAAVPGADAANARDGSSLGSWRTVVVPAAPSGTRVVTGALPPAAAGKSGGLMHALEGVASYYWQEQMTASGERFNKAALTAAHRTLPLGTRVRVTHVASGRNVVVRINDRGPFKPGRVIDLSQAAAEHLQMTSAGLAHVRLNIVP